MFTYDAMAWGSSTWDFQIVFYPSPAEAQDCLVSDLDKIKWTLHGLPEALRLHPHPLTYVRIFLFKYILFFLLASSGPNWKKNLFKCTFSIWRTSINGTVSFLLFWVEQFICLKWNVCSDGLLAWNSRVERQTPLVRYVCRLLAGVFCLLSRLNNIQ